MDLDIKISIIVPAYNVAPWISRCLDSVLNQTYRNLEILVIDDGSTDGTSGIIDEYAERDGRIIALHQKNAGLVSVREKGISIATGQFVGFVDGDDMIEPDMYERLLKNALKYDADISHCGMKYCFYDGRVKMHYGTGELTVFDTFTGIKELLCCRKIEPSLCNKLYRRNILEDSCLDKEVVNYEDLLRNFVLFQRTNKSVFEDFCGYQYWRRENSMSNNSEILKMSEHIIHARRLIVENSPKEYLPFALQSWMNAIVNAVNQLVFIEDKDIQKGYRYYRKLLKQNKKYLKYLNGRQRLAACLTIISPKLHRMVYGLYKMRR